MARPYHALAGGSDRGGEDVRTPCGKTSRGPAMNLRALLIPILFVAACSSNEAEFNVRFAPGFAPPRHAVSVFGVYKDGQMSAEAWDTLAPKLSSWLGTAACSAGYVDGATAKANAPLWSAVDDYARSNGPTDDLLAELAPAAQGDLVMVITVAGKVPEKEKTSVQGESAQPSMSGGGGGGMGGMGGMGGGMRGAPGGGRREKMVPAGAKDALDLAALLYSASAKIVGGRGVPRVHGPQPRRGARAVRCKASRVAPGRLVRRVVVGGQGRPRPRPQARGVSRFSPAISGGTARAAPTRASRSPARTPRDRCCA